MTSPVEKFVEEPSRAVFDVLTKDQLIQLADHYKIEILSTLARRSLEKQKLKIEAQHLDLIRQGKMHTLGGLEEIVASLRLIPPFNDKDVDTFFLLFERVADAQGWPSSRHVLLLQCVLTGRAQRAFSALSLEDSRKCESVNALVLKAYKLIPEAYRQHFRNMRKRTDQSHVEFARDLRLQCQRWSVAANVKTYVTFMDLIVLEQFKSTLPERVATYVAEKQAKDEAEAAVSVDEYELTHRAHVLSSEGHKGGVSFGRDKSLRVNTPQPPGDRLVGKSDAENCYYCHGKGHWKGSCPVLKSKSRPRFLITYVKPDMLATSPVNLDVNSHPVGLISDYSPFISDGFVSLLGSEKKIPVKILCDTGVSESFILDSVLLFSSSSSSGRSLVVRGIDLTTFEVPLHKIMLYSELVEGEVELGGRSALPVDS